MSTRPPSPWHELPRPGVPDLWLLRLSEVRNAVLDVSLLDATEHRRIADLAYALDRTRFTAAHLALRRLLGAYHNVSPQEIEYTRGTCPCCGGPHGRPGVLNAARDLHFSLSYRGDLVLMGTAAAPIGIDVELVPDPTTTADLTAMLHPEERREIGALAAVRQPRALARIWTRKEAYLKGLGSGLGRDPAIDYVGSGGPDGARPPSGWTLLDIPVDRGYAAAAAVQQEACAGPSGLRAADFPLDELPLTVGGRLLVRS